MPQEEDNVLDLRIPIWVLGELRLSDLVGSALIECESENGIVEGELEDEESARIAGST